ncbi:DNA helicase PIF1, ATP-dependent [Tanacetum coccineum]|uniref:DNA helicase PIF1, ATP-dependent n=1 Tax=Tanacetum coccineum TaxID=301880 RepID=A0ABQ5DY41_9ASTR
MSNKYAGIKSDTKVIDMVESSQSKLHLFLDQLEVDVASTIIVMIGRVWDVNAITGRYLSTDFVISDSKIETFHYKVMIENMRTKKGRNYLSCGADNYRKGADNLKNYYVKHVTRLYRLEVMVADDTAHTVIVMFNDKVMELLKCSAESLLEAKDESAYDDSSLPTSIRNLISTIHVLELKSHTYYEYGTFESFTCWKINPTELVEDGASSSTQALTVDDPLPSLKRLSRHPSVCTPSKPNEEKKKKRSELEDSNADEVCGPVKESDKYNADGALDKKKKKRPAHRIAPLPLPDCTRININQIAGPSTSKYAPPKKKIRPLHLRGAKKATKKVAFTSAGGKVLIPNFNDMPPPLNNLLNYNPPATSKFRDQIRVYNSMFCFTSFGAKIDHSINTALFFDTQNEVKNRTAAFIEKETNEGMDEQIVRSLIQMLDQYSSIAKAFRMARDWCNTHNSVNFYLRLHNESCICHRIPKARPTTRTYSAMAGRALQMQDASEIDDIILADLSSPIHDLDGYKVVTEYMLHGPCGKDAKYAACTSDGKCLKKIPKQFLAETFLDEEGYPYYRRRDNKDEAYAFVLHHAGVKSFTMATAREQPTFSEETPLLREGHVLHGDPLLLEGPLHLQGPFISLKPLGRSISTYERG